MSGSKWYACCQKHSQRLLSDEDRSRGGCGLGGGFIKRGQKPCRKSMWLAGCLSFCACMCTHTEFKTKRESKCQIKFAKCVWKKLTLKNNNKKESGFNFSTLQLCVNLCVVCAFSLLGLAVASQHTLIKRRDNPSADWQTPSSRA